MEEFKDIEVYGVILKVSNLGRVFLNGKERKYHYSKDGYKRISLKGKTPSVHILVAKAFVYNDDPCNKIEVNHKDFDRTNSRWDNLEWVTHKENIEYSKSHNRYSMRNTKGKNNPNYGNDTLKIKYKDDPELAKKKQSRPGIKNGRCVKVDLYFKGEYIDSFDYIVECLQYIKNYLNMSSEIENIRSCVNRSIRNGKSYKGFTFVKHK